MQKNVAGQKWVVFAFNRTTNVPETGDAANITANLRLDGGAADAVDDTNPAELEDGYYIFDITQTESNCDYALICPESGTADIQVIGVPGALWTTPPNYNALGIESDGDIKKVNSLDGHTAQTGDAYSVVNHADHGNAKLVRSTTPANALDINATGEAGLDLDNTSGTLDNAQIGADAITAAKVAEDVHAEIADAVWDEILTAATHNDPTSAGRQMRELSSIAIRQDTAQAGTANTITFDVGASATDCIYDRNRVSIVEGTGVGESGIIILYIGATRVAIMDRPWAVIPDNTSVFQILAGSSETDCLDHGYAQAGAVGSITLKSDSSAINDFYRDCEVMITGGTGEGQQRLVTGYTGASQLATVSPNWKTTPDNTSIYHIKYAARKVTDSLGTTAKAEVNTECDTAISDADLITALKTSTGYTAGGTITYANLMKIIAAAIAGDVKDKSGGGYDIYDVEDGTTVVITCEISETSPYVDYTVS